jgi:hypothetical protein
MALTPVPGDLQGGTGSQEAVQVVPNNSGSVVTIAAVSYGGDTSAAQINQDGTIFTITIKNGKWPLYVFLHSPDPSDGSVKFQQTTAGNVTVLTPFLPIRSGIAIWRQDVLGL